MKRLVVCLFLMSFTSISWAIPRPMESIENYNVLMIHGAYGQEEGVVEDAEMESDNGAINYQRLLTMPVDIWEKPHWVDMGMKVV